ncbi:MULTISPECIES: hypothetical protein [Methanosarcina]|uniref:Uncharacterized protein n=1 Tax=Methanosarcina barkeri CM1 TaxID=796385 RepID=A0A0G3CNH2_METBA|nr:MULTISPECIES: hypothetical protein [Methanosarcina]AKJ40632.1 hypothetical protein MCM1_3649 [Methanosarcina barkeri CM1]OEC92892.1 hypothetical protein A9239_17055 [Methanosarcina sp. A14]
MLEPKCLIDYILQDPVLNLSGWIHGEKNGSEALTHVRTTASSGEATETPVINTMDLFGATL